jgi:hypothetical protein
MLPVRNSASLNALKASSASRVILRNSQVRVAVLTSCSSAASTPNQDPYPAIAFDGIAQRLLRGLNTPDGAMRLRYDSDCERTKVQDKDVNVKIHRRRLMLPLIFSHVNADTAQAHCEDASYGFERPAFPRISHDEYAFWVRAVEIQFRQQT